MPWLLVADDHPLVRAALATAVEEAFPGCTIDQAADFGQVMKLADRLSASLDLVLLDLNMPGADGFAGLASLRARHPALPIMIVSGLEDQATIGKALALGVSGYLPKSSSLDGIGRAIRSVLQGGRWVPEGIEAAPEPEIAAAIAALTPQQRRVLALVAAGKLNKQIAYELGLTEATVKAHVTAIFRRLGVTTRTQAALALSLL